MDVTHLQVATIAHLHWKSKLSDFFYGVENLTSGEVPDHMHCEFGKWLYSSGLEEFSSFPEMKRLEILHKEFHEEIKRLIQMPEEQRKSTEGRQALDRFKAECDIFINLLEKVQSQAAAQSV